MILRQIQHFQTIVQENSFTTAAEICNISQSGISQSIKALEDELGVTLISRKNRGFSLTKAGEHFYRKSLVISADLDQLCRETIRIDHKEKPELRLGILSTYSGEEFTSAMSVFSEANPTVELSVITANHEDLYNALRSGDVDLVLNDQRRAFSDAYENVVLTEMICKVEIATHNPMSKCDTLSVDELKNMPCILVASVLQQEEEERFYRDIIGFKSEFLFADTLQAARLLVVANRGFLPVETSSVDVYNDTTYKRVPILRNHGFIKRKYCAFWKKGNPNEYIEPFAETLKPMF